MVWKLFLIKLKDLKCYYIFILSEFKNPNISPTDYEDLYYRKFGKLQKSMKKKIKSASNPTTQQ